MEHHIDTKHSAEREGSDPEALSDFGMYVKV